MKGRQRKPGMENGNYLAKALKLIPNRFLLVKAVAYRIDQLCHGAQPLVDLGDSFMPLNQIALREIAEGKLVIKRPINL